MAIENTDILSLNYYTYKQPFSGSYQGMRYRVERQTEKDEEGKEKGDPWFLGTIWPEPFSFEATEDDKKVSRKFPFSEEGKAELVSWLNETYQKDYA